MDIATELPFHYMTSATTVDLTNCDREPIHLPGSIQPHGFLLGIRRVQEKFQVAFASQNASEYLPATIREVLGADLASLLPSDLITLLDKRLLREEKHGELARYVGTTRFPQDGDGGLEFQVIGHRMGEAYIVEFEETPWSVGQGELNSVISNFVTALEETHSPEELCDAITVQVRQLTGFDRVMLYRFDAQDHGTVLSEDRNDRLPSYLGLRFPASDIPRQARALYVLNRTRIIPDVDYAPSPLVSYQGLSESAPIDLSLSTLRSVSPIHREYMRNMGTIASMSISVVSEGRLWGMISGHHSEPKMVPYLVRSACDLLSRIMSAQLVATQQANDLAHAIRLKSVHSQLLTYMAAGENYIDGLVRHPEELCAVTGAAAAAVVVGEKCICLGEGPTDAEVHRLSNYLDSRLKDDVFVTNEIGTDYPHAADLSAKACGVLAISLSQIHRMQIIWFRPEVVRSVHWAGEPAKGQEVSESGLKIHPRNSFATWKQIVRGKSEAWSSVEVESARDFRNAVLAIVLKRAEELADLASELELTNKELEAFSYSVSHDLRAPFRHISGFAELLLKDTSQGLNEKGRRYLNTIAESAQFAGLLVDSLLNFSRITRTKMDVHEISMAALAKDVWRDVTKEELGEKRIEFTVGELPPILGDLNLMRQVLRNLFSNAAKYSRKKAQPTVHFDVAESADEIIFSVKDNGVGFDNQYAHKLFGAFQRLHRIEDFEGTGIGLANVRRIISRMGGRTWAEGHEGEGAVFFFSVPRKFLA